MKSLVEHPATALTWRRCGITPPDFELLGTAGVFATLAFLNEERTFARVRTAEGVWTLKHLGILTPVVTLRVVGGTTNLATFHPHALRHGKLQFLDGASFDWKWLHEGGPGGAFLDPEGQPLVRLQAPSTAGLEPCDVLLDPSLATHGRSALLAAFGWYLLLFDQMKESEAVVAETTLRL
jgi:hypothetical protein